jgi:membrane dipeptidase
MTRRRLALSAAVPLFLAGILLSTARAGEVKKTEAPAMKVFDLHCDTVYQGVKKGWDLKASKGAVDIPKMRKGSVTAQTFALWTPPAGTWAFLRKLHKKFESWMKDYGGDIELAVSGDDIDAIALRGKIAAVLAVEGLSPLGGDLEKIPVLHGWGVRILGLVWMKSNEFAGSSTDPDPARRTGLTEKGRKAVAMANELGMVIDVSHASDDVVRDVAELSCDPFIASHSCAKALRDHPRNLSDDLLKLIASKGGVVGVNFYTTYLTDGPPETASRKTVVKHILHMVEVMGVDHVALGSDFDGAKTPVGLKTAAQFQLLAKDLLARGLSQEDVAKIMGGNALRVFRRVTAL